jgi:hypothetical protein
MAELTRQRKFVAKRGLSALDGRNGGVGAFQDYSAEERQDRGLNQEWDSRIVKSDHGSRSVWQQSVGRRGSGPGPRIGSPGRWVVLVERITVDQTL